MFYPIARNDCVANPNQAECLGGMWDFHTAVYEWGFLLVLVTMWVVWFWRVGGPARTLDASNAGDEKWRLKFRQSWSSTQFILIAGAILLMVFAVQNVTSNEDAMSAKETLDFCYFSELVTSECGQAQNRWDDAIGYAWSLSALSIVVLGATSFVIQRPDENGKWPVKESKVTPTETEVEKTPTSRHSRKKSGSWKESNQNEEE